MKLYTNNGSCEFNLGHIGYANIKSCFYTLRKITGILFLGFLGVELWTDPQIRARLLKQLRWLS